MTSKLQLVRVTKKQTAILGELLVYFYGRRLRAMRKTRLIKKMNPTMEGVEHVEPIPLTKIYELHKCNTKDRAVVKVAANVFFKQSFRGNNVTKKCSGWTVREEPHINAQVERVLKELFAANAEHTYSVRKYLNTPEVDAHTVVVTSTFVFKDKEQAAMFAELMTAMEIKE